MDVENIDRRAKLLPAVLRVGFDIGLGRIPFLEATFVFGVHGEAFSNTSLAQNPLMRPCQFFCS